MRSSAVLACALIALPLLSGCPKLTGASDADASADASAVVAAVAAVAPSASSSAAPSASAKPAVHAEPKHDTHASAGFGPTDGPACKPGQKVVMEGAATIRVCVTPCQTDADCKEQYATCYMASTETDFNDSKSSFHRCGVYEAEAPKGSPMEFPNPRRQKCPMPYTNMENGGKQVCFMRTPKTGP